MSNVCPMDPNFDAATKAKVEAAVQAVDAAVTRLKNDAAGRKSRFAYLRSSWKGGYGDQFRAEVGQAATSASTLLSDLLTLRKQLNSFVENGTQQQQQFDTWQSRQPGG